MLASDGLFANEERGGGGGLSNDEIATYIRRNAGKSSVEDIVDNLIREAQNAGSTDDITVVLIQLRDK